VPCTGYIRSGPPLVRLKFVMVVKVCAAKGTTAAAMQKARRMPTIFTEWSLFIRPPTAWRRNLGPASEMFERIKPILSVRWIMGDLLSWDSRGLINRQEVVFETV
jgi:hypothetical protein